MSENGRDYAIQFVAVVKMSHTFRDGTAGSWTSFPKPRLHGTDDVLTILHKLAQGYFECPFSRLE